jgi:uncharacterized protein (TIGR00269 family)
VLFGNVLHWQTGYIASQAPVLPASPGDGGLARKAKPFCCFYERETAAYVLITSIDYIYDECPYVVGATSLRYKGILNQMEEESPGTKLQFYLGFLRARKEDFFRVQAEEVELHPCPNGGQPTSASSPPPPNTATTAPAPCAAGTVRHDERQPDRDALRHRSGQSERAGTPGAVQVRQPVPPSTASR